MDTPPESPNQMSCITGPLGGSASGWSITCPVHEMPRYVSRPEPICCTVATQVPAGTRMSGGQHVPLRAT
jgi:hypothetical protein